MSYCVYLILGLLPFKSKGLISQMGDYPFLTVVCCVYAAPDARIRRSVLGVMVWLFLPCGCSGRFFSDWQKGTFISYISMSFIPDCIALCSWTWSAKLLSRLAPRISERKALCSVVKRALSGGPSFCSRPEVNYSDLLPYC